MRIRKFNEGTWNVCSRSHFISGCSTVYTVEEEGTPMLDEEAFRRNTFQLSGIMQNVFAVPSTFVTEEAFDVYKRRLLSLYPDDVPEALCIALCGFLRFSDIRQLDVYISEMLDVLNVEMVGFRVDRKQIAELAEGKAKTFSNITPKQANVVAAWLRLVAEVNEFEWERQKAQQAIRYWEKRARLG
jgi:hypothetical protein